MIRGGCESVRTHCAWGFPSKSAGVYCGAPMRGPLAILTARLRAHLETLARFGRNPDGKGITRSCWSPAHEEARAWLLDRMKEAGLSTWVDEAGTPRRSATAARRRDGLPHRHVPVAGPSTAPLASWRASSACRPSTSRARARGCPSWWRRGATRKALRGSLRLARVTGKLDVKHIPSSARPTGGARRRHGPGRLQRLRRAQGSLQSKTLAAYVELHIEQGPAPQAARIPIGVVEGIVGNRASG